MSGTQHPFFDRELPHEIAGQVIDARRTLQQLSMLRAVGKGIEEQRARLEEMEDAFAAAEVAGNNEVKPPEGYLFAVSVGSIPRYRPDVSDPWHYRMVSTHSDGSSSSGLVKCYDVIPLAFHYVGVDYFVGNTLDNSHRPAGIYAHIANVDSYSLLELSEDGGKTFVGDTAPSIYLTERSNPASDCYVPEE